MQIACLGEVMLELSPDVERGMFVLGIGGDTYNTAVMLARQGILTKYITRLGKDELSKRIINAAESEGISTQDIDCNADGLPGLYLIQNNSLAEREFYYWREQSPATTQFESESLADSVVAAVKNCEWLYLSGITTAVMARRFGSKFLGAMQLLKDLGVKIAFDPNFRPAIWPETASALHWHGLMLGYSDLVLPTMEDEQALWGAKNPREVINRCLDAGASDVVVKCPKAIAIAWRDGQLLERSSRYNGPVIDTTGAGDAFNAGYLACVLRGDNLGDCLDNAHAVASKVIAVRGAIP